MQSWQLLWNKDINNSAFAKLYVMLAFVDESELLKTAILAISKIICIFILYHCEFKKKRSEKAVVTDLGVRTEESKEVVYYAEVMSLHSILLALIRNATVEELITV